MSLTSEETQRAIINLNTKTGLNWVLDDNSGQPSITLSIQVPGHTTEAGEKNFTQLLKEKGVDFSSFFHGTKRNLETTDWVNISAAYTDPLIIKAMANNQFSYPPPLNHQENEQIATMLTNKTGVKWEVNEINGEVSCLKPLPQDDTQQGIKDFKALLKEQGIDIEPSILPTRHTPGILVTFSPLELRELSEAAKSYAPPQHDPSVFVMKDPQGDHTITDIKKHLDGRGPGYKLEGANNLGQPQSAIVYNNGVVANGSDGSTKLGLFASLVQMFKEQIFKFFNIELPKNITAAFKNSFLSSKMQSLPDITTSPFLQDDYRRAPPITSTPAPDIPEKPKTDPYILIDPQGNNLIIEIRRYSDPSGDGYLFQSENSNGEQSSIVLYNSGMVINGNDGSHDLDVIGTQMLEKKESILLHFLSAEAQQKSDLSKTGSSKTPEYMDEQQDDKVSSSFSH